MKKNDKHNRRKFFSLGLLTGAAFMSPTLQAEPAEPIVNNEETVKLLTPDGKLVEVKKSVVENARSGSKVSNQEILNWTNSKKGKL